ncbi:proton-coupled zinc antiporter SLC30A9, mitochondrial [Trichomycterus rosablanca]|uniref:proton-coupled zinc antiporter SLC30A9, mitochondrial n=1 Tax=Trichomycterus rosablanca TaxID=2290929 RepID=UPI002F3546A6
MSKVRQVIRWLMILLHHKREKRMRSFSKGWLLILQSAQHGLLTFTVAAAGSWCQKTSMKSIQNEARLSLSSLVSLCECPYPDELQTFSNHFGHLHFAYSFKDQNSQESEIERFLSRFSLVYAQLTVIFRVRSKDHSSQQVFSAKSTCLAVGYRIAMDSTRYGLKPFSARCHTACSRMHPTLGDILSLSLSSEAVEAGLCGEVKITSVAMIGPCMDQYPNWPTNITCIRVLAYGPSGVPLMQGEGKTQLSFIRSLADSLPWGELGLHQVCYTLTHTAQGSLCADMEFSVEHNEEPEPGCSQAVSQKVKVEKSQTVEQTLFIFLFIQYSDPFHSQLADMITNEELLEQYLDKILWHNEENMRSALESVLKNTVKQYQKRKKSRETVESGMSVMLSSLNSIVSSSSNAEFRAECLNHMKVQNTYDFSISLNQSLQRVIIGRFVPRCRCTAEKVSEAPVLDQNDSESTEGGGCGVLHGKRARENEHQSPLVAKRQCPGTSEDSDASESCVWEMPLSPVQPLDREHAETSLESSPNSPCSAVLRNQEFKKKKKCEKSSFQHCSLRRASLRMFPSLAHRPWQAFCRIYLHQRVHLSQLPARVTRLGYGWQSGGKGHSLWYSFPDHRGALAWAQVQYYSTDSSKDGPPTISDPDGSKSTKDVTSALPSKDPAESKPSVLTKAEAIQVKVRAVLKKREYGTKYTQNNFITIVRAMNEFCLKSSDLDQLRRIRRRSPHDDTEAFTVFLRSDVEAKALEVWGSMEALARERKLRKEEERQFQENMFRSQQLVKEYKDFWGNTKPRSGKRATFLQGPGKVVMVAICINGLNFFFKLLAWVYTGSASMFSEAIHSLADTCNQALLALGISQSVRNPDPGHPYGFSNMRYIASLISGVGIFMMGAGLSWYHGIMGLMHPHQIESLLWAYCILAGSLVSEGATLLVAINEIKKSSHKQGLSFYEYVMQSRDPSTNVVLLEDAAAVLGVVLAAGCMGLTSLTGNPYYDSLGSLGVGTLLGTVSAFLIYTNTEALLGRSIQAEHVQKLTEFLESDPAVRAIHDVKATDMGLSKVRFKAEVDFDGRVVTRSYLEKQDIDQILNEIQQVNTPEELEAFMLKHGENIIDTLGAEVDRLEKELKQRNPEVRHVDLEIL